MYVVRPKRNQMQDGIYSNHSTVIIKNNTVVGFIPIRHVVIIQFSELLALAVHTKEHLKKVLFRIEKCFVHYFAIVKVFENISFRSYGIVFGIYPI